MASLPVANDTAEPVVAAEIIVLNPAEIEVGERLREVDPIHAEAVGWSMVKDGQINPIDVCRLPGRNGWHLAGPGGHRLAGALTVGMDGIEARVVSPNRDTRRLREAVENFFRRANDPIERAAAIAEIVQVKRARAGVAAADHRTSSVRQSLKREVGVEAMGALETISNVYGWTEEIGAELGFTGRTIRNDLLIYRGIAPSLVSQLRAARHPVLKNATQLRALAKLETGVQAEVADALTGVNGWEPCRTVAEAIRRIQPAKSSTAGRDDAKRQSTIIGTLARMSASERLALFQSPLFHAAIPAEARALLAPMLRTLEGESAGVEDAAGSGSGDAARLAGYGQQVGERRLEPKRRNSDHVRSREDQHTHDVALVRGPGILASQAGAADKPGKVDLTEVIAFIEEKELNEHDPDWIVAETAKRFNGTARYNNGTYELRVGGIVGTCTSGGTPQLSSWKRAARKRLLGLERVA